MGDFGLVTALPEEQNEMLYGGNPYRKHTAQVGTQLYMSPEQVSYLLLTILILPKVDVNYYEIPIWYIYISRNLLYFQGI
jgi:serine/threonine protein kinase